MSRDYRLYLDDIVTAVAAIQDYIAGYDFAQFAADRKTIDAVLHNLAIIGEAASKVNKEMQTQAPEIEWRKITGFRNIVVHEYFGVNHQIVWDIVTNKIRLLSEICQRVLDDSPSE